MNVLEKLRKRWQDIHHPFLIHSTKKLYFDDVLNSQTSDLSGIERGDVVALIGDFDPNSIITFLRLIEKCAIIVPLTNDTKAQHSYFFETALVDFVIEGQSIKQIKHFSKHSHIEKLRQKGRAGLILFSTGTTGRPKAILHDLTLFMQRFETPRPTLKTINFLLFDHIGGLNTLLHTLFNNGTIIAPKIRTVEGILEACREYEVEVLPTTPTFLRMMLISGLVPQCVPMCLRIITYGTERMDQSTLESLCKLLPWVDFRQTFGMSELGIVRVKSKARDSLFMKIGGEGIKTRVKKDILEIQSQSRMIGYLNSDSPFDKEGWYKTNDLVEELDGYFKIVGRVNEVINVGGLKFMPSEVERIALEFEGIELAKAQGVPNPITGEHVELTIQVSISSEFDKNKFKMFLDELLPAHMLPRRIKISQIPIGHRYKKL